MKKTRQKNPKPSPFKGRKHTEESKQKKSRKTLREETHGKNQEENV